MAEISDFEKLAKSIAFKFGTISDPRTRRSSL